MTAEEKRRVPRSTEVSTGESVNPQLSARFADDTERLSAGQLIGARYRIERELGEGGMGVVYLAADEQVPGEKFAVKVLKQDLHPEALELLREEVHRTRKLSHPNILDVHSVNLDGRRLFVLMEYLEGKSLEALLDEEFGRGMAFSRAWPIIEDVGAALSNAHDHSIIHSDLKPANIFVTTSGRTKLLDFGIARVSRGPRLKAPAGLRALTPAYASCEMLEGKEADRRDDIYSFACVIYEMLCGERPFGGLTALEAREARAKISPIQKLSRGQNDALCNALAFARAPRTGTVETLLAGLSADTQLRRPRSLGFAGAAIFVAIAAAALVYGALNKFGASRQSLIAAGAPSNAAQPTPAANPLTAPDETPPSNSLAVLPFVNISGDSKQEYFSDGLSEELIDHLVHRTNLKVIARTSSFQFKGKTGDVRSIARTLGVTHLLEGSVRRDGQQLRITAQLVRGSDGVQMWSQSYDRNLVDIFKVQDEISGTVAQALSAALDNSRPGLEPDIRAYNLVLEGNFFKARRNLRDVERAAELYQQAIDISPNYALAWARLASAYLVEEILEGRPSENQSRKLLTALNRAIRLDPNLAWSYYTRAGFELNVTWDWEAAESDLERMRDIDPRFEVSPRAFGDIALTFGEIDKAIDLYQEYLVRSPLDPYGLDSLGTALCAGHRFQQCLESRLRLQHLSPEYGGINRALGLAYLHLHQLDEALGAMQREADENYKLSGLAIVYSAMGKLADSDAALNSLVDKFAANNAYEIAEVHAHRGETDEAFRWLDRAYLDHNFSMVWVKADPILANLHGDRRFQALLGRMRLNGRKHAAKVQS